MSQEDLTKEFKDILQKGISYLKNVEASIDERIEQLTLAKVSLDLIDELLEKEFVKIKDSITPLASKLNQSLDDLKPRLEKLCLAQKMISDVVKQLKTDVPFFSIKDLYKRIEEFENFDFSQPLMQVVEVKAPSPSAPVQKKILTPKPVTLAAPIPTLTSMEVPVEQAAPEGDWNDSEVEGANIFEELITGWKRRDWEQIGGNKEIFIKAWPKLSSYDKQKIKSGTWSKPIMNKVKLLGRE